MTMRPAIISRPPLEACSLGLLSRSPTSLETGRFATFRFIMKKLIAVFMIMVACCLVSGCIFVPTSESTVKKWQSRVNKWLPVGTTTQEICQIMSKHGFTCFRTHGGDAGVACENDTG